MPQIEDMIQRLDANPARKQKVYVYEVDPGDVAQVQQVLKEMFETTNTNRNTRNTRTGQQNNVLQNRATQNRPPGATRRLAAGKTGNKRQLDSPNHSCPQNILCETLTHSHAGPDPESGPAGGGPVSRRRRSRPPSHDRGRQHPPIQQQHHRGQRHDFQRCRKRGASSSSRTRKPAATSARSSPT
jgi:hypothetical protein